MSGTLKISDCEYVNANYVFQGSEGNGAFGLNIRTFVFNSTNHNRSRRSFEPNRNAVADFGASQNRLKLFDNFVLV